MAKSSSLTTRLHRTAGLSGLAQIGTTLRHTAAIRRQQSEAGSYTYLSGADGSGQTSRVDGPQIESPRLKDGAGSILWLKENVPDCLEVYTFGDKLPIDLDEFTLTDIAPNKPLADAGRGAERTTGASWSGPRG